MVEPSVAYKPRVSVIIASYCSQNTIGRCLKSLEEQVEKESIEVIVVDSSNDGTASFVAEKFPWVRLFAFPDRKFCGEARNISIKHAQADIIAFIDSDCTTDKHWIKEIIRAHVSGPSAIGGGIANGNPKSYVGWAAYFTEFSSWMPKTALCWMDDIAGANMSYKRDVFERFGPFLEGAYCSDTDFHWRLKRNGIKLKFQPSMLVFHHNIDKLDKFLKHEFVHGRFFAMMRGKNQKFSKALRLIYAVSFFFIFLKLLVRVTANNIGNRVYLGRYILSLPLTALGILLWALGEGCGYLRNKKT